MPWEWHRRLFQDGRPMEAIPIWEWFRQLLISFISQLMNCLDTIMAERLKCGNIMNRLSWWWQREKKHKRSLLFLEKVWRSFLQRVALKRGLDTLWCLKAGNIRKINLIHTGQRQRLSLRRLWMWFRLLQNRLLMSMLSWDRLKKRRKQRANSPPSLWADKYYLPGSLMPKEVKNTVEKPF